MKHYFTLLLLVAASIAYCQSDRPIHNVHIQTDSYVNGELIQKYVDVDSKGLLSINGKETKKKINLKGFTKGIQNLISVEKLEKKPATNYNLSSYHLPGENEKIVHVYISFADDFNSEKNFKFKSSYELTEADLKANDTNYNFLKYFEEADIAILKQALE